MDVQDDFRPCTIHSKPPELLSDHPADQTRINDIKTEIPEAMKYYNKN